MSVDISYENNRYLDNQIGKRYRNFVLFIVPFWVDAAIQRNRLNYMSLKDISTLGQYVSLNDMAEVLALSTPRGENLLSKKAPLLNKLLTWNVSEEWFGAENNQERPLWQLAGMPNLHMEIVDRLSDNVDHSCEGGCPVAAPVDAAEYYPVVDPASPPEKELYKIIAVDHETVVIVLQKGILNKLGDKEYSKGFLSAYLRALYSIESVTEVSKETAFYEYVFRL
jgi:hypothetical protein